MSRELGSIVLPGNIEAESSAPLDARSIVNTKADLYLEATWKSVDNGTYVYKGMLVTVINDGLNNGIYRLDVIDYSLATSWIKESTSNENYSTNIAIGSRYQGGYIAYILQPADPGYLLGYNTGFIVNPTDILAKWTPTGTGTVTGVVETDLMQGGTNTDAIILSLGAGTYAAQSCKDLVSNGYSDWVMPTKDELEKIYINQFVIGGLSNSNYISSSEFDITRIWGISSTSGLIDTLTKSATLAVKPIRYFSTAIENPETTQIKKEIIQVDTYSELPTVGDDKVLYLVRDVNSLYSWSYENSTFGAYQKIEDITIPEAPVNGKSYLRQNAQWVEKIDPVVITIPRVGDLYGGGQVAYILKPTDTGYEVSRTKGFIIRQYPVNGIEQRPFALTSDTIAGLSDDIGTGNTNTLAIIANQGEGDYAAKYCSDLSLLGFSDWYLPSKTELKAIRSNRTLLTNFVGEIWSSYSNSNNTAESVLASGGGDSACNKVAYRNVYPIRDFSIVNYIDGGEKEIITIPDYDSRPIPGDETKLYKALDTGNIYSFHNNIYNLLNSVDVPIDWENLGNIKAKQYSTFGQTLTYASEVTMDCNLGQMANITLTGNVKLMNPTNLKACSTYQIFITQGGTGSYALTLDTAFKNEIPALSTTVGSTDVLTLTTSNGTDIYCTLVVEDAGTGTGSHSDLTNRDIAGNHAKLIPTTDSTTAIQITKADGTTPVFSVDTTNKRIGIGTNNPVYELQVVGDVGISTGNAFVFGTSGTARIVGTHGAESYLAQYTNGTEKMRILENGNVGIGTAVPGEKLQVAGAIKSTGTLTSGIANSVSLSQEVSIPGAMLLSTGSDGSTKGNINIAIANSDLTGLIIPISISNLGNIGFGVVDPDEQLEMTGRLHLGQTTAPVTMTDKLYNVDGELYWNGSNISSSATYPQINDTASSGTITLAANTVTNLTTTQNATTFTFALGAGTSGFANEYIAFMVIGDDPPTITYPANVRWLNSSIPTINSSDIVKYQFIKISENNYIAKYEKF